jgi:hypothetical protein
MRKRTVAVLTTSLTQSLTEVLKPMLADLAARVSRLEERVLDIEAGRLPGWRGESRL